MSKKKKYTKHIEKGRFYHIHEGSKTGHPGLVYWKNDNKNLYLVLTTDSSDGPHRTKLTFPTSYEVEHSYVQNRPVLAKRKDIGSRYDNMRFYKIDKPLLKAISKHLYRESPNIKRNDRRFLKKLKKKPKY